MALSLRQLKSRISSIENIRKLTKAMEMVSVAKLKPLQRDLFSSREYSLLVNNATNNLLASFNNLNHRLLERRLDKKKILLCLITSDTGLCGSYNSNIIHIAEEFIRKNSAYEIGLLPIGRKGLNYFKKKGFFIEDSYTELYGHYSDALSDKVAKNLSDIFLSHKADEVYIAYANYISASKNYPVVEKIFNIEANDGRQSEYLVESDIDGILEYLIPLYILTKLRAILLSAFTAENSTRVIAMHEATKNAKELLDDLVVLRNKVRQANITTEITEVISSADALKG